MTKAEMQAQLDKCCRRPFVKQEKPLTGIEREFREQHETKVIWDELRGTK